MLQARSVGQRRPRRRLLLMLVAALAIGRHQSLALAPSVATSAHQLTCWRHPAQQQQQLCMSSTGLASDGGDRLASALCKVRVSTKPRDLRAAITVVVGTLQEHASAADASTLEALFAACRACAGGKKAVALLRQCRLLRIEPTPRCYNYALEACLKFGDDTEAAQLLSLLDKQSIPLTMTAALRVWTTLGGGAPPTTTTATAPSPTRDLLHKAMTAEAVTLLVGQDPAGAAHHRHRRVVKRARSAAAAQSALGRGHLPVVVSLLESMARRADGALDLHGVTAAQATCAVLTLLEDARLHGGRRQQQQRPCHVALRDWAEPLVLITGRGRGSRGGVPVIKPALASLLRGRGLDVQEPEHNPGILVVRLGAGVGEAAAAEAAT